MLRSILRFVLSYASPINTCGYPGCDVPTSGVFCTPHATI